MYQVQDFRKGKVSDALATCLRFYQEDSVNESVIISHFLSSRTGMSVALLFCLEHQGNNILAAARWKGQNASKDTVKGIVQVLEHVLDLTIKRLQRKSIPHTLAMTAKELLRVEREL